MESLAIAAPPTPAELEEARQAWLPRAEAGEHLAMVYVAIALFLGGGSRDEEINWLRRAMASEDSELLIATAEELVFGTALHRDLALSQDFLVRSWGLSNMKGAYALSRFHLATDPRRTYKYLKQASDLGHIPSWQILTSLPLKKKGPIQRRLLSLRYLPRMFREARNVIGGKAALESWWRHKDVHANNQVLENELGEDRRPYFAWAGPSSLSGFCVAVDKGKIAHLKRNPIDANSLLPLTVDLALRSVQRTAKPAPVLSKSSRLAWHGAYYLAFLVIACYGLTRISNWTAPAVEAVHDIPPSALFEVVIDRPDRPGIPTFLRPVEFGMSGDRTVKLPQPSQESVESNDAILIALHDFDGVTGAASFVLLSGGSVIRLTVSSYDLCSQVQVPAPFTRVMICTHKSS